MATLTPSRPHVFNLPNVLTGARLVLAIVLFWLIDMQRWPWCVAVFAIAAATDWFDGYLARRQGLSTALGRIFDPLVDKVLICGAYIFLLVVPNADGKVVAARTGLVPWMVTVVVARELIITGMRSFFENRGVSFGADWLGKIKMGLQCAVLFAVFVALHLSDTQATEDSIRFFHFVRDALIDAMLVATALSGLQYLWRAGLILRNPE
jgi:CDP-diacylglycerol--glycerol-3-phosphate 3-phosphatidyltransferase